MNGQSPRQPRPGENESIEDAARRLQEEMQTAVRHLREQVLQWPALGRPQPDRTHADDPDRSHDS
ncbi:hypothetical protein DN069_04200 [Streptacidiphilus pinicola]|uniref:Uncharacterized protein n=1 Tax=Streptacidiphilus pinicola TaxID=2219663 RepID=A0A2X0J992_9ACTN|nr:hypothetical protein [Streptacidiphilus pinicola]RAG86866.1 hypothetical protein DN069_04200 [Streptacidiphilus pinicola]